MLELGEADFVQLSEPYVAGILFLRTLSSFNLNISSDTVLPYMSLRDSVSQEKTYLTSLVATLSPFHRHVLQYVLTVCAQVAANHAVNHMNAYAIGVGKQHSALLEFITIQ